MLSLVASRSTCRRRAVAAIITDHKGMVLSTGYNGVPRGIAHCLVNPCPGVSDRPGDSSRCEAVHAEVNSIVQCADLSRATIMYVSCTPCFSCAKMILNTPIKVVRCVEAYADRSGIEMLSRGGIQVFVGRG